MAPNNNNNNNSLEIPEGWVLGSWVDNGTVVKGFLCPETGQHFATYDNLMRYVRYAKAAKLSIYSPDSNFSKMKEEASKKISEGQSSKSKKKQRRRK